jgi:basic membrane protein A
MVARGRQSSLDTVGRYRPKAGLSALAMGSALALVAGVASMGLTPASPAVLQHLTHRAGAGVFRACELTGTGGIRGEFAASSTWAGLGMARLADPAVRISLVEATSESSYGPDIAELIGEDCDIVVTVGEAMARATQDAAQAHPGQLFAIVDGEYARSMRNVRALSYATNQGAFLAGFLAAAMSTTGKVGTFGGEEILAVVKYMDGWVAGVRYFDEITHKRVAAVGWTPRKHRPAGSYGGSGYFLGSFSNTVDGRAEATTLMQQGVDVIFPVAGAAGLGAAAAVKPYGHGVTMEWSGSDGCVVVSRDCGLFLTSVTDGIADAVRSTVLAAAHGRFIGGNYVGDLANNGVGLARYHHFAKVIPMWLQVEVDGLRSLIISGGISVDPDSYPLG